MKITSAAFNPDGMIPQKYTCEGEGKCPPLEIIDPPAHAKSFAILMNDPDAPSGDFAHWLIWNIDAAVQEIMEGTTPVDAIEGTNDFGQMGWGGPCPPTGKHRYVFHLYALDTSLDLPATSKKEDLRGALKGHIVEEASLLGFYKKTY